MCHDIISSCQPADCKALLVTSLTHVSSARASTRPLPLPLPLHSCSRWHLLLSTVFAALVILQRRLHPGNRLLRSCSAPITQTRRHVRPTDTYPGGGAEFFMLRLFWNVILFDLGCAVHISFQSRDKTHLFGQAHATASKGATENAGPENARPENNGPIHRA